MRQKLLNHVVDATARRPRGWIAARPYRGLAGAPPGHEEIFQRIVADLEVSSMDHCVDVGCGGGRLLELMLAQRPYRVAGIDHSREMIQASLRRNRLAVETGRLILEEGDAHRLPWAGRSFTVLTCVNAFFFLERPQDALADWARVLRQGGRLALATRPAPLPRPSFRNWWVAVWGSAMRVYDDEALGHLIQSAGFSEISIEHPAGYQLALARLP